MIYSNYYNFVPTKGTLPPETFHGLKISPKMCLWPRLRSQTPLLVRGGEGKGKDGREEPPNNKSGYGFGYRPTLVFYIYIFTLTFLHLKLSINLQRVKGHVLQCPISGENATV